MNIKDACALDYCFRIGWLSVAQKKWRDIDRQKAGNILREAYLSAGLNLKAINYEPRVDTFGVKEPSDARSKAEDFFRKAVRSLPKDFAPVVLQVCIENKVISGKDLIVQKYDLCRGLDYLCDFLQKKRGC